MIKQLIGIPLVLIFWWFSGYVESWYWLLRKILISFLNDIKTIWQSQQNSDLEICWNKYTKQKNDLPFNNIYHIPRAVMTLIFLYLCYTLLGFELALYLNAIGMILYEWQNTQLLHGDWKFYKKWGYKIGNLKIPYPTYAGWVCIAIINFGGILKVYTETKPSWEWWLFYIIAMVGYWSFSVWNHKEK